MTPGNYYVSATPLFLPHTLVVGVADGVFTFGTTSYCSLFLSTKKYTHPFLGCNLVWVGSGLILGKLTIKTTKFNPKPNGISNRNEPTQTNYLFLDWLSLVLWVSFLFKTKWTSILKSRNRCREQKKGIVHTI